MSDPTNPFQDRSEIMRHEGASPSMTPREQIAKLLDALLFEAMSGQEVSVLETADAIIALIPSTPFPDGWVEKADALLALDAAGALVPHGIGADARTLIEQARNAMLAARPTHSTAGD